MPQLFLLAFNFTAGTGLRMSEQLKMKIVKKPAKSPEVYIREHEIGMFRQWCEIKYRHIFDEMAQKLGYQKPKSDKMKAAA
jgi:hypothetical protein